MKLSDLAPRRPPPAPKATVRVTRAILRHPAGAVVTLRASQAAAWIAAGCAERVA